MAISTLHTLSAVKIDPDVLGGSSVTLGGIRRQMVRTGTEVRQETVSGAVYSQFQAVYAGTPMAEFSTVSIARAMDAIGLSGIAIAAASQTGLTLYGNKKAQGGTRAGSGANISYNIKEGILVPRRITVDHQGDAVLDAECLVTYDGTNAPIVQANTANLLSSIEDDQRYTIGPIQLGTVTGDKITLSQIQRLEIDFGINASAEGSDSDIYPTFATINDIARPVIRITTLDLTQLVASNGIPLHGKDLDSSHTIIYLKKRARVTASGFVADGTEVHISFVPLIGCAYHVDIGDYGSSGGNGAATIEIPLIASSAAAPLAMDTTAAISFPA